MLWNERDVVDWRDLQEKVRQLFAEMDYDAEVSRQVKLAGRGEKEIDVYVTDPHASYNKVYLVECKHWVSAVPQSVVHGFKTVMEEVGANTGFIVSKVGFQSGAYQAAQFTNIHLLTFEGLQDAYGYEWFRKQRAKLDAQVSRLRQHHRLHFDDQSRLGFHNNVFFQGEDALDRLDYFGFWMTQLVVSSQSRWPESYRGPEPVRVASDPENPGVKDDGWYEYATVRDYFSGMTAAASRCADEFDTFLASAKASFDALPEAEQDAQLSQVLGAFREELPIRVLKSKIPPDEYAGLLSLLSDRS